MEDKGLIKKIFWPKAVKHEIDNSPMHSIFNLGTELASQIELGEPIQIIIVDDETGKYSHYGLAEVTSIKVTTIGDIEELDFKRQKPGFKSIRDVLISFKKKYPEYRADINKRSPITVFTIRKLSYSLDELNKLPSINKLIKSIDNKNEEQTKFNLTENKKSKSIADTLSKKLFPSN